MAEQRDLVRGVVAVSSVVVALCAVVVTIKVLATGVVSVKPERVLDPATVVKQVTDQVAGLEPERISHVACPVSVVVEVNNRFQCQYDDGPNTKFIQVTIVSDQGELSIGNN